MNEKKLYAVTAGSYSDYHIIGLFSDKAKAEEYVACHNKAGSGSGEFADVEEYIDGALCSDDGFIFEVYFIKNEFRDIVLSEASSIKTEVFEYPQSRETIRISVRAKDEEHAKKIAADKLAEYLAKKQGI